MVEGRVGNMNRGKVREWGGLDRGGDGFRRNG